MSEYAYARAYLEGVEIIHDHTDYLELELPVPKSVYTLHGRRFPMQSAAPSRSWRAVTVGWWLSAIVSASFSRRRALHSQEPCITGSTPVNAIWTAEIKEPYLLSSGGRTGKKGLDLAVRVAGRAGMRLVMAIKMTEKHEQEYFHEHVDPWLEKGADVMLLGEITPAEKFELYVRAQGTLFSSQWESPLGW